MLTSIPRINPTNWNVFPEIPLPPIMIVVTSLEESFEHGFRITQHITINVFAGFTRPKHHTGIIKSSSYLDKESIVLL
jgi:hypothetical protein